MKVSVYNQNGKATETKVDLPDSVFSAEVKPAVMALYNYVFQSNQRGSIAHTKDRGDVSGGGRKPWRQKGTGRARVGSNRSPIWKGGGVTFGPTNARNWKLSLPRKVKKLAIRGAFTNLLKKEQLQVLGELKFADKALTKQAAQVHADFGGSRRTLLITAGKQETVLRAFANLPDVSVVMVEDLNAHDLMVAHKVILMNDAIAYLNNFAK